VHPGAIIMARAQSVVSAPSAMARKNLESRQYFFRMQLTSFLCGMPKPRKGIIDKVKGVPVLTAYPQKIGKLGWCRARSAFASINRNKIGIGVEFYHGFTDGKRTLTFDQCRDLKAHGFATG